ncbi:MAG TPA: VOC family protein [Solirubrobacterales bacterium]|nr:VOC family protein [Solirubrobacterales bacterium]
MIHHVSVDVSDLERSGRFYDALLGPLGWRRQVETDRVIAWGIVKPIFFAALDDSAVAGGGHVCFTATGIPAVRASWEDAQKAGGTDDGAPGPRPEYGPSYYSAYLRDPDGHRVEVAVGTG